MIFNRKKILEILINHQSNIDKRAINPIFSSVRLLSNAHNVTISSMDGQRHLQHAIEEQFEKFDIFLPGFNLYELLRKSNSETFEIIEQEKNYLVKIGSGEFVFSKYSQKDYPQWVDAHEHEIEFDSQTLVAALRLVKWAASNDDSRPFLNGVCFDLQEEINICSTDGLRLALQRLPNKTDIRGTWIFSRKSVNDLIKLLEDSSTTVKLRLGKNAQLQLHSKTENVESDIVWKTLLIAGKFPQYSKIIPTTSVAKLKISSKDFVETIDRMLIIANINQPIITLQLGAECAIFSENSLFSGKDQIVCIYEGPEIKISFNGKLLLEIFSNIAGELEIDVNNPHSPILIKSKDHPNALFILAPVKRDN